MTDFELMGAALDEARKAAALGEVPVGLWWPATGRSWRRPTTPARRKRTPCIMPSCWPSTRPARRWAAGGCGSVSCSSRWSPAPCARGHPEQPHPAGGVRRGRCQGRVLRQCDGPVCPAVQPPPDGGAGPAGRGSRSTAAGVFQAICGCGLAARPKWKRPAPPAENMKKP